MRQYSVSEDCLVLEAAVNAHIHRRHGKHGGVSLKSEELAEKYRKLCHHRGVQCRRSEGSLKMRLYRMFCAGVMKWGPSREKAELTSKSRRTLGNYGTPTQKTKRDNLLWQLFGLPDGSYCVAKSQVGRKPGNRSRRKHFKTRKSRPKQRKLLQQEPARRSQVNEQYPIAPPQDTPEWQGNMQDVGIQEPHMMMQQPIATPETRVAIQPPDVHFGRREPQSRGMFAAQRDRRTLSRTCALLTEHVVADPQANNRTERMNFLFGAYKENLKAFRALTAVQRDSLEFMRSECEKHREILEKGLEDMTVQQEHLVQLMRSEAGNI